MMKLVWLMCAAVLEPLSGKVKIMMNRSVVDGSPRLLFDYQAIHFNDLQFFL
jgi:hypothetical protein